MIAPDEALVERVAMAMAEDSAFARDAISATVMRKIARAAIAAMHPAQIGEPVAGATTDKPDAISAAQDVLAGRGNGTYDEALDAIRWLLSSSVTPPGVHIDG